MRSNIIHVGIFLCPESFCTNIPLYCGFLGKFHNILMRILIFFRIQYLKKHSRVKFFICFNNFFVTHYSLWYLPMLVTRYLSFLLNLWADAVTRLNLLRILCTVHSTRSAEHDRFKQSISFHIISAIKIELQAWADTRENTVISWSLEFYLEFQFENGKLKGVDVSQMIEHTGALKLLSRPYAAPLQHHGPFPP